MTIQFYAHSIVKKAKETTLIDSGATKNFMNLTYAKWLWLPIKQLAELWKLFNIDGTENKSGELRFYTDLQVWTGTTLVTLRFFLSDLGEHKAILGYPWFAATQPKIDWKRGWINHTQLPIILQAPNAKRAIFVPRTCRIPRKPIANKIYVGRVTFTPPDEKNTIEAEIPAEYSRYRKVFNEEKSQRLP